VHGGYAPDEPELLRSWTPDIPVIIDRDRVHAASRARGLGATVVVLDDAFQHRRLRRDLDIVLVSVDRWSRVRRLLPRGPWREPATALTRAHLIVAVRKAADADRAELAARELASVSGRPVVRAWLRADRWQRAGESVAAPDEPVALVAGVADPAAFAANARAAGARIETEMIFPDHHAYSASDTARIRAADRPIVTTAKDWIKLRHDIDPGLAWVLAQTVVIEAGHEELDAALARVLGA
jgi:tetraacyldisaccharide 4'-kinase